MRKIKDIRYSNLGHERQVLDLYLPEKEEFPVFVYFHGGGIYGGDKSELGFVSDLVEKGVAVVCANYRLYPTAVFPDFIRDAAAAVAWTKRNIGQYGTCTKVFVGGSSAGGYLTKMLCFDKKYLAMHGIDSDSIDGYFMDAGQPTSHFNVLVERGYDSRRVIVDETAPLYFVEGGRKYAPMKIIVSDHDMENRFEQTQLLLSTLKHVGTDMEKVDFEIVKDSTHCSYVEQKNENGKSVFAEMVYGFIERFV